jgi:putative transposase
LNTAELEQYMNAHCLSDQARLFIREARARDTVIDLQTHQTTNSIVLVYSKKMGGRHLPARSRTLLAAATRWHEFNDDVREYYVEPCQTPIETLDHDGVVRNRGQHTFRFLVLDSEPCLEDWREEGELLTIEHKDAERAVKVGRYWRDDTGIWHDRDAEAFCQRLGLRHRLRTSRNIPQRFLQNLRFLQDYMEDEAQPLAGETCTRIKEAVASESVTFSTLLGIEGFTADVLFTAIAQQIVYVNLFEDNLRDPEYLFVHRDRAQRDVFMALQRAENEFVPLPLPAVGLLRPGSQIKYGEQQWECVLATPGDKAEALFESRDGCQLVLPVDEGERLVLEQSTETERVELLACARRRTLFDLSSGAKEKAIRKLKAVRDGSGGFSSSTMARARRIVSESASTIDALIALAGRDSDKGCRAPRFPPVTENLAKEYIESNYNQPATDASAKKAYDKYQIACVEKSVPYMSYVTFLKRVAKFKNPLQRSGKRVAYRDGDIPLILDIREPVHGLLPHEVLYCDHTLLNLATSGPERQEWGKAWLSAGIDGHVPVARAMYLSYAAPSVMSVLMLLRDYVRRHGRLPRVIVVDGGKEFRTAAFTKFCSIFGIEIRYRAPGRPRGGTLIERMFGVTEDEFLSGLQGNTSQLKEARMTTASVQPNQFRTWTFPALYRALDNYLFRTRPEVVHPAIGMTPAAYEAYRMEQTGHRRSTLVAFDENLLLLTCPAPSRLYHKIYPGRGIWDSGHFYWHPEFSQLRGQKLEIRVEPWNENVLYAYSGRRWIVAIKRNVEPYHARTRYEVDQARREGNRLNRSAAARDQRSPKRARRLVESQDRLKFDDTTALKQQVMAALYGSMGMTCAMPLAGIVPALPAPAEEPASPASVSSNFVQDVSPMKSLRAPAVKPEAESMETPDEETAFI